MATSCTVGKVKLCCCFVVLVYLSLSQYLGAAPIPAHVYVCGEVEKTHCREKTENNMFWVVAHCVLHPAKFLAESSGQQGVISDHFISGGQCDKWLSLSLYFVSVR